MSEKSKKIIEKVFSILLSQPELLSENNKNTAISILYNQTKVDFEDFENNSKLRSVTPTNPIIREIYFNNIDITQFTGENIDQATEDLRLTVEVWENNRGKYDG